LSISKLTTRISREILICFLFDKSSANSVLSEKTVNRERQTDQFRKSDFTILIAEIRQLLFGNSVSNKRNSFVVFFSVKKDCFYIYCVQSVDRVAIVVALNLLSTSYYLITEKNNRLKLIDFKTIVEQAAV